MLKKSNSPFAISSGVIHPLPYKSNILKVSIKLKSVLKARSTFILSSLFSSSSCALNIDTTADSSSKSLVRFRGYSSKSRKPPLPWLEEKRSSWR